MLATDGDKFGHWWVELDNGDSYGWWPDTPPEYFSQNFSNWLDAIFSVPGVLNQGREVDPHSGLNAETTFNPIISSDKPYEYTCGEVEACITDFAGHFGDTHSRWEWPFGANCHTFQTDMMSACGL